jgi:hypothetical protein
MISLRNLPGVDAFELANAFEALRRELLAGGRSDRLAKPLAWWALPGDRRLPLALLDRRLGDLLNTPFGQLLATPGIGTRKAASLVKLIERATSDEPPSEPLTAAGLPARPSRNGHFDPEVVSEALWAEWRQAVRKAGAADKPLGQLAPRLSAIPTVIWHTPLSVYLDKSVQQIRRLKTYGEKRVRVVLEVFHGIHRTLTEPDVVTHLDAELRPRFIVPIQRAIATWLAREAPPGLVDLKEGLAHPLVAQIAVDGDDVLRKLCETRLGLSGAFPSVRSQSSKLGVTRARVYQLFEECAQMMHVRWPEGRKQLAALARALDDRSAEAWAQTLCRSVQTLFYPEKG